jgi:hypothetical protein
MDREGSFANDDDDDGDRLDDLLPIPGKSKNLSV